MSYSPTTIVKADAAGQPVYEYGGACVYRDEEVWVLRCIWTAPKPFEVATFRLQAGDVFMEFYYPHEWFNVFRVYSAQGRLKGWYCNISRPPAIQGERLIWPDLALDLLVLPDGQQWVLDRDEFEALALDAATRQQAEQALDRLRARVAACQSPFQALAHPRV